MSLSPDVRYISPSLLAAVVRKNDVVAFSQLSTSLQVLGFSPSGLPLKVRRAADLLVGDGGSDFNCVTTIAHPGAINSWGLLWRSGPTCRADMPPRVFHALMDNWIQGRSGCKLEVVCQQKIRQLYEWARDTGESCEATACILLTSVWIQLLSRDRVAAQSWTIIDIDVNTGCFYVFAATYKRADGVRVIAAVPVPCDEGVGVSAEVDGPALNRLCLFALRQHALLEIYTLNFPSCGWHDRPTKSEKWRAKIRGRPYSLSVLPKESP